MADFCKACSEDMFGKDFGDLAGLIAAEDVARGFVHPDICEGCGTIGVDDQGRCMTECLLSDKEGHNLLNKEKR